MNDQKSSTENEAASSGSKNDAAETPPGTTATVECWRCGKQVGMALSRCSYCAAILSAKSLDDKPYPETGEDDARNMVRIMAVFGCMFVSSIVLGLLHRDMGFMSADKIHPSQGRVLAELLIFEGLDTILILFAWLWIPVGVRDPRKTFTRYMAICGIFTPILAICLLINVSYHWLLWQYLNIVPVGQIYAHDRSYIWWWLAAICFQPAIIEELFFRGLAFGALRSVTGAQTAVWITALMFALSHIGVPLSMPVLFVLGLGLGYARMVSGGIFLCVAMHFIHNLIVMKLNGYF
jgi:uncharacterized protein